MQKCFYRKVGYGLSITDKVPPDPLQWAQSQVASVPTLHWTGKTYSTKDGIEFARKVRRVQDKADKTKDREKIRKRVIRNKNSIIVASYGTYSTGINIPNLDNIAV